MMKSLFYATSIFGLATQVAGECANACNGHGKCTSYDMCTCNRNWQANDCSERVCQFGLAHVDTPKGDLNHDGVISGPRDIRVQNSFVYPYGTTEQFPRMQNSDLMDLSQSAHYYMECSNKGTCNRDSGECECFDGYDGAACQRASCPGYPDSCSGHGVCKSIRQLAASDNNNIYELWDKDSTMGCECDAGFFGPDCSQRKCKYGVDPLYLDDTATIKYSTWNFAVVSKQDSSAAPSFTDGMASQGTAYFAIRFYDAHGEDWLTRPIEAGADCDEVIDALNDLPNDVIPTMDVSLCTKIAPGTGSNPLDPASTWHDTADEYFIHDRNIYLPMAFWTDNSFLNYSSRGNLEPGNVTSSGPMDNDATFYLTGYVYRIHMFNNPGKLKQPEIEIYLDGKRPSITDEDGTTITKVWTDGQQGENVDYVADHCDGVTFTLARKTRIYQSSEDVYREVYLEGLDEAEEKLLKACLGPSDFDVSNNQDVYEWDVGSEEFPHFVKIVRSVTSSNDGGHYAALYYEEGKFKLVNNLLSTDVDDTSYDFPVVHDNDQYEIYTTKGTLALTSKHSEVYFGFASNEIIFGNITGDQSEHYAADNFNGDISCEFHPDTNDDPLISSDEYVDFCLNKGDMFTVLAWDYKRSNPNHINLYTAEKIYKKPANARARWHATLSNTDNNDAYDLELGTHVITTDLATNWANGEFDDATFRVYKFFPHVDSTYEYVAPCSNRGICDESTGICNCFGGYTNDDCSEQNSLAV